LLEYQRAVVAGLRDKRAADVFDPILARSGEQSLRPQRAGFFSVVSFSSASSPSASTCMLASDCVKDSASVRGGGEWRRSGGEPRNSASSRRVNSPRSCWRLFGGDPASGSRVGTPGGGSPLVSDAGRCAGLGAGRRTMLGSITTSFRPPISTRCSILSRRTSLILRFPSSWTDSITPTRCDALRSRSHLNMLSPHIECRLEKQSVMSRDLDSLPTRR